MDQIPQPPFTTIFCWLLPVEYEKYYSVLFYYTASSINFVPENPFVKEN